MDEPLHTPSDFASYYASENEMLVGDAYREIMQAERELGEPHESRTEVDWLRLMRRASNSIDARVLADERRVGA